MGTQFLLIRHASVDAIGRYLAGRKAGIHLNQKGKLEAEKLAGRLEAVEFDAIYTSPLERALETAAPLGRVKHLRVNVLEELTDIDFGDWTGAAFSDLERSAEWHRFNRFRASTRVPGGESMLDVQHRMVSVLESMRRGRRQQSVAVVSHCDPIRAVLMHYLGANLDCIQRIAIEPASVSVVELNSGEPQILSMNELGESSTVERREQAVAE